MNSKIVYSEGAWITVFLPKDRDPSWTIADEWVYASAWASAQRKGFSALRSEQIAEAIVVSRLYTGAKFDKSLTADIETCYVKNL
jgi:hypothetical protein